MELVDRFAGCLLGLAIGDALGAPVEGLSSTEIATRYGQINEMLALPGYSPGQTTDDTAMMLCILESYIELKSFDPQDIADRFLDWFVRDGVGIGRMTYHALRHMQHGYNFERSGYEAWQKTPESQRLGNGSLMRAAPTGLLHYHDDVHLIGESRVISSITHYDETCRMACAVLNLAISHLLLADAHVLIDELLEFVAPRNQLIGDALKSIPVVRVSELRTTGYVIDTLQTALWASVYCTSFEEGMTLLVNLGGDTDTICAVGGALLGARFGSEDIPVKWLQPLKDRKRIEEGSIRLYNLSQELD